MNNKIIALGYSNNGSAIFLSSDFAVSFSEIGIELSPFEFNSITIDNDETIYLASNILNENEHGVYKSEYPYIEWTKLLDGTAYTVNVDSENGVFAGTYAGVFQSINNGVNWQLIFDEQIPRTFPYVLETDNNNHLLIGTYGYGLFELQLPTNVEQKQNIPLISSLSQNYPNPFNPSTVINYSTSKQELITLKLYDITGKEVSILVNEVKNKGTYSVNFDASKLSSGVYFYKLQTKNFFETKKMLLLR
ncbi:MAG: T9SS type A sorting domain-containing protein [Bacteroidetes bacterium]|nr:T9SS type A sorting domain-containing protein [Bacteroidota bacterium]